MALSNGFDMRASSLVTDISAAIERVVAHFEENDIALRLDVLRALSAQAKLAFETERVRERLHQHPLTKDLIDAIATKSTVFERLVAGVSVEEYSCEYDAQRNVEILATVRWLLRDDEGKQQKKKRKKAASKTDRSVPLILRYTYSRSLTEEGNTLVEFRVTSCVGVDATPKELVHFAVTSSSPYPRSFYEDNHDGDLSDDEQEEEIASGEGREEESDDTSSVKDGERGGDDGQEPVDEEQDAFDGEAVEAFHFDDSVVENILTWMSEDDVDPADVVSFFLALPVSEDEWQLDERITEIIFNAPSDAEGLSDHEEDEGEGSDDVQDGDELD